MSINQEVTLQQQQLPIVEGIKIRLDNEGRYNLNDLHKASETNANKAPAQWLRTKQAQELVDQLEKETVQICIVSSEGRNGGTFAHELLAISYAGWISPVFQLTVNQTFIDSRRQKPELVPSWMKSISPEAIVLIEDLHSKNEVLMLANKQQGEHIESLSNYFKKGCSVPSYAKTLNGVNSNQINAFLVEINWLYKVHGKSSDYFRVCSYARDRYLTEVVDEISSHGNRTVTRYRVQLLEAGAKRLYQRYLKGDLPMKKTWDGKFSHRKFEVQDDC